MRQDAVRGTVINGPPRWPRLAGGDMIVTEGSRRIAARDH